MSVLAVESERELLTCLGELLDAPASERHALVRSRFGDDESLVRELERLLAAVERPDATCLADSVDVILQPVLADLAAHSATPAAIPSALADALAPRYTVHQLVGRGGMASVYLAFDSALGRNVAIKSLRPELSDAMSLDRFEREITIAATVDHPRVVPVYDRGNANGMLYYVMRYVEGRSLRDLLLERPQLEIRKAIDIARDVADALDAAHAKKIVHRDIKPANILLDEHGAHVADFGVARLIDAAGRDHLTRSGIALGTVLYMSPEQVSSAAKVDGRSDVYALACVLYEMLAGEAPFTGPTQRDILAKHLAAAIPDLTIVRATITRPMQRVIATALQKSPADRFAGAGAFIDAFEQAWLAPNDANVSRDAKDGDASPGERAAALSLGEDLATSHGATLPPRRSWRLAQIAVAVTLVGVIGSLAALPGRSGLDEPRLPTRRQLTFTGAASMPALSPDGRTIAFVDGDCANAPPTCREKLMAQDVSSNAAVTVASARTIDLPQWSPDGTTLLFGGEGVGGAPEKAANGTYLVNRFGGSPQRIDKNLPAAFGPGGDTIVTAEHRHSPASTNVRFARASDGRVLDSMLLQFEEPTAMAWSPDGRWLAMSGSRAQAYVVLAIVSRSGRIADSVTVAGRRTFRWLPEGNALLVYERVPGTDARVIRRGVDPRTGRFTADTGTTELLPDVHPGPGAFGVSRDGKRLAFTNLESTTEFTASEVEGDRVTSHRLPSFTGWTGEWALSPDGRHLAYARRDAYGDNIYVTPFDGGPPRALTSERGRLDAPRWLNNSRLVVKKGLPSTGLLVLDLMGAPPSSFGPAVYTTGSPSYVVPLSDSTYALDQREQHRVLILNGSGSVRDTVIVPDTLNQVLTETPDGRQFWFFDRNYRKHRFYSLDRGTHEVKVVLDVPNLNLGSGGGLLGWTKDGDYLFATAPSDSGPSRPTLWRVNPGRDPIRIRELPFECGAFRLAMSRDGRRFVCRTTMRKTDIWLIEGYNPRR